MNVDRYGPRADDTLELLDLLTELGGLLTRLSKEHFVSGGIVARPGPAIMLGGLDRALKARELGPRYSVLAGVSNCHGVNLLGASAPGHNDATSMRTIPLGSPVALSVWKKSRNKVPSG